MRRTLVVIACLLMLTLTLNGWLTPARAQDATPAATPGADCVASTEEQNADVARQWYDVWGTADDSALADIVQPDLIHHWAQGPDTTTEAELDARTDPIATAFPDLHSTVDLLLTDGDYVVVRWIQTGTQTGPYFDLAPSGVEATWTGINIFRFECGLIAESWSEFDGVGLEAQLTGMSDPIAGDLATPAADGTPVADCAPTTEQGAADVAARWGDLWDEGDIAVFDELASPDSVHHWGLGQDTTSLDDFKDRIGTLFAAFSDLTQTSEEPVVDGDLVAIRWTMTGTQDGPIFGFEPTGAEITWTGINIFRIECGQVVESWSEADGLGLRDQLEAASGAATPAA